MSHEFMAVAECGEDIIFTSPGGEYRANRDVATAVCRFEKDKMLELEKVHTPEKKSIEDVANIKFTRGPKTADSEGHIKIGNYGREIDSKGNPYKGEHHATLPARNQADVDIWFVDTDTEKSVPRAALGNAGRHTITHELGHAMGLTHPGNYNGSGADKLGESNVSHHEDSQSHSGMSYRGERTGHHNHQNFRSSAPQLDDIAAYQAKYGAKYETRKDDTTYGFNSNTDRDFLTVKTPHDKMVAAIWDGGGNDTLDFSGYTQDQQISLREETFSDVGGLKGNVAIAKGAVIENAIGGKGNDLIIGNDVNNELNGGDGNDVIYGGKGGDRLWGGKDADTFVYGSASESFDAGRQDQRSHDEITSRQISTYRSLYSLIACTLSRSTF
jgi:serralysin